MGADIAGWVEVGDPQGEFGWVGVVKAGHILSRSSRVFAYLFGKNNSYGFEPIAPLRGLPEDISPEARSDYDDFTQRGAAFSESWIGWWELDVIEWEHNTDGSWSTAEDEMIIHQEWQIVLNMMEQLADFYGERYVRLVVWFDM